MFSLNDSAHKSLKFQFPHGKHNNGRYGSCFLWERKNSTEKAFPIKQSRLGGSKNSSSRGSVPCYKDVCTRHVRYMPTVYQNVKHPFYWLRLHLIIFYSYTCFPSISCVHNCTTVGVGSHQTKVTLQGGQWRGHWKGWWCAVSKIPQRWLHDKYRGFQPAAGPVLLLAASSPHIQYKDASAGRL